MTLRSVGSNGGSAAAFTYDLARSVVYTRQGNPAWAGDERDSGVGGGQLIRSDDQFYGAKAGDVQPDWVNLDKVEIPQADEQQHLLTNLIEQMNLDRKPLPRFWFLPRDEKAAVVMTGDDHGNNGTTGQFNTFQALNPGCSVADWECVRSTSYIYPGTPISDAQANAFETAGFEIALHVNTNCGNWTSQAQLEGFYSSQLADFASGYPSLDAPVTNRTHCIAWSDWATQPKVELANGIRLDTNYYYWPDGWIQNRPGMFTGSGMPQRFADLDGSMVDVYQATTQMTDESGQSYPLHADTLLDNAIGPEGYYGVFTTNMHTDSSSHPGANAIIGSALSRDVPVVSARQMLEWLDGRNGSSFENVEWNGNDLGFEIAPFAGSNGLRAMVPTSSAVGQLTGITRNGSPVTTTNRTIKGTEYAFIDAAAGSYVATYDVDETPPAISNVAHSAAGDGTATITWDTNEASNSRVDYGTSAGALNQSETSPGLTTSHSIQLSGLAPNTTYYYRVSSADAAANSATEPNPPAAPASFTTPSATFTDTTVADFSAGSPDANTYVSETGNGEVILKPAEGQEFSGGPGLPAGWTGCSWPDPCSSPPGPATVSGGALHVNGGMANTTATYPAGRSLEFVATFGAAPFQHVAFTDNFNSTWAMFSTRGSSGGQLYASTNPGNLDVPIGAPGQYVGSPHLYRIQWNAGQAQYYVDGNLVHTEAFNPGTPNLNVAASDFNAGGPELSVDWLRISPYPSAGTFTSRVFDAGQAADWGALTWHANAPPGTGVALSVRTGNTPTPDGSWSAFTPIASSGGDIPGNSRYVQYRAELTGGPDATVALQDVSIGYSVGEDTTAPTITGRSPAPDATGVPRNTSVEVQFSEAMNPATIDGVHRSPAQAGGGHRRAGDGELRGEHRDAEPGRGPRPERRLRRDGRGGASGVKDASGNAARRRTTPGASPPRRLSFIDTTVADFSAGTPGADTYVSETDNGEVILKPTEGSEFSGSSIPAGWSSCPWSAPDPENCTPGTGATVSGGSLHADGAYARTTATYGSGRSLEFRATFNQQNNQHVGFGVDLNNSPNWAIFSVKFDGTFNARTNNGGATTETPLPSSLVGSPHLYRIEWDATALRYYVDGALVATHSADFGATQMRPLVTDLTAGGPELTVDWLRMSPYPGSGTFDSRVFDAGAGQARLGRRSAGTRRRRRAPASRSASAPATPRPPTASWSSLHPDRLQRRRHPRQLAATSSTGPQLTSSDTALTPVLSEVSIGYAPGEDTDRADDHRAHPSPDATGGRA